MRGPFGSWCLFVAPFGSWCLFASTPCVGRLGHGASLLHKGGCWGHHVRCAAHGHEPWCMLKLGNPLLHTASRGPCAAMASCSPLRCHSAPQPLAPLRHACACKRACTWASRPTASCRARLGGPGMDVRARTYVDTHTHKYTNARAPCTHTYLHLHTHAHAHTHVLVHTGPGPIFLPGRDGAACHGPAHARAAGPAGLHGHAVGRAGQPCKHEQVPAE